MVLLTHAFWRRQFGADPAVVGTSVLLNDEPHTIVGLLPEAASVGAWRDRDVLVAMPLDGGAGEGRAERDLFVTARLNEGVRRPAAAIEIIFNDSVGTYVLMVLLGSVALLALCLAAAGIYGVVSYAVTRRTREIGVRIALGATPLSVQRLVVWQGSLPAAAGGIVGLLAAVAIAFVSAGSIPEVDVRNPASYGIVVVCLAVIAVGASYLPARRASRIDPAVTLRAE